MTGETMDNNEFMRQSKEAVEKMREMNARAVPSPSGQNMPPVPPFVRLQGNRQNTTAHSQQRQRQNSAAHQQQRRPPQESAVTAEKKSEIKKESNQSPGILSGLNIPFLDMLAGDADVSLIIGLMLILMSEKADKKLLFALIYILL